MRQLHRTPTDRALACSWRIALCAVAVACAAAPLRGAAAESSDPPAKKLTVALLDVNISPIAAQLKARLLEQNYLQSVGRDETDRIVAEHRLANFLGPTAGPGRARLGQFLKADLLAFIQTGKREEVEFANLIVSETRQGLRLVVRSIPLTGAPADAAKLMEFIHLGAQKVTEKVDRVFAVPPFTSNDLTQEHDDLKQAYAQILQEGLLRQPGVVVVELEEAKAITGESTPSGNTAATERQLPLHLLGEYRSHGEDSGRQVELKLTLKRGEQMIATTKKRMPPNDAPSYLRLIAQKLAAWQPAQPSQDAAARRRTNLNRASFEPLPELDGMVGCTPCGDVADLFYDLNSLHLMKAGELKEVWRAEGLNDRFQTVSGAQVYYYVCFDGRFAWASVWRHRQHPLLLVLDPLSEQVWEVSGQAKLPVIPVDELPEEFGFGQHFAVAPIAPGKVCVASGYGQSWIAIVEFDPQAGATGKVIHESRASGRAEEADPGKATTRPFTPTFMAALSANDGTRRIVIGRASESNVLNDHPLIVNPETQQVEVSASRVILLEPGLYWTHQRTFYSQTVQETGKHQLVNYVFPGFEQQLVLRDVPGGKIAFIGDRLCIANARLWTVAKLGESPTVTAAVPWTYHRGTHFRRPITESDWVLDRFHISSYYGLLVSMESLSEPHRRMVQVLFPAPEQRKPVSSPIKPRP